MTAGHVVEVRKHYAVCLTCGQVSSCKAAITHVVETFLGLPHERQTRVSAPAEAVRRAS